MLKVSQHADCFVIGDAEGFVAVGIGDSAAEGFVWSGAEGFGGTFLADFVDCHPSPLLCVLLHFCKWSNAVPTSIFLWLVCHGHGMGDCCKFGLFFCFDGGLGLGTGVGGIDESFLVSNRFYDGKLVLGQGVPCLTGALGISSSCGGLSLMDLVVGCGTLANCHMASLCIVTGIDSAVDLTIDVCVLIVTTVGGSWGWVGRCRVGEYPHLVPFLAIIVFLLLTLTLGAGDFLTLGLVLG